MLFRSQAQKLKAAKSEADAKAKAEAEAAATEEAPAEEPAAEVKSIMQSKHILLIANGEKKAQIIRDAFFGPVTPKVPASILQLHNNVTVIVDKEAGKLIKDVL